MHPNSRILVLLIILLLLLAKILPSAHAQPTSTSLPLDSLAAFTASDAGWQISGNLDGDPRRITPFTTVAGTGVLVHNRAASGSLTTSAPPPATTLDLDFLLGPSATATVAFAGLPSLALPSGNLPTHPAPLADAARAPGLWQHLRIEFPSPRAAKVTLNGFVIHENLPVTRASAEAESSLTLSATGSVAVRAIRFSKPTPPTAPSPAKNAKNNKAAKQAPKIISIPVDVTDTILLQRGFIPYEPKKRLYATSVGTPAGVHYAYDFETGALLRVWRGRFIDAGEMWEGRSANQWAKPTGPALTLNALPPLARLDPAATAWPASPDVLAVSRGYSVEATGQPEFLSTFGTLAVRDRIAPAADHRSLTRTLTFSGPLPAPDAQPFVLLARAHTITAQPGTTSYTVGDREYHLDLAPATAAQAVVLTRGDHQLLVVPVTAATLAQPLTTTLVW